MPAAVERVAAGAVLLEDLRALVVRVVLRELDALLAAAPAASAATASEGEQARAGHAAASIRKGRGQACETIPSPTGPRREPLIWFRGGYGGLA